MKTLYMETTQIPSEQTVGQIQGILGLYGACQILTEYKDGQVSGVAFRYPVNGIDIPFHLPCRWEAIREMLLKKRKNGRSNPRVIAEIDLQARRVAWRQILRWVEAQLALTDTRMTKVEEVFFPYIQNKHGKTLFEQVAGGNFKMLELEHKQ